MSTDCRVLQHHYSMPCRYDVELAHINGNTHTGSSMDMVVLMGLSNAGHMQIDILHCIELKCKLLTEH